MRDPFGKSPEAGGFTLLEALVVMALLGVMVSLAAPAMSALRQQHQLQAEAEGLLGSLVLARSEALRRQQRVTVCASVTGSTCDANGVWSQGWLAFADANDNAQRDAGEALIEVRGPLPSATHLAVTSTDKAYFSYNAEGRSATIHGAFMAGTWRFCRPGMDGGWQVVSNALGRPRLEKVSLPICG